jgi:hypothetical protein
LKYVGFKFRDPTADIGFDIAAEYEEARRLQGSNDAKVHKVPQEIAGMP